MTIINKYVISYLSFSFLIYHNGFLLSVYHCKPAQCSERLDTQYDVLIIVFSNKSETAFGFLNKFVDGVITIFKYSFKFFVTQHRMHRL